MPTPDSSVRTRNTIVLVLVVVVLAVAAGLFYMSRTRRPAGAPAATAGPEPRATASAETEPRLTTAAEMPEPPQVPQAALRWEEQLGSAPAWPRDLSSPQDCEQVDKDLQRVCTILDSRAYASELTSGYATCDVLRQVADELAARPPRTSSELRSYETILANVFFVFRALGRERMQLPARLLVEEQELAEPLAMALYRWAVSRESCVKGSPVTHRALYDYAGFLFNTMGGQAYLRRRTPRIEALACFYALQIIDTSQQKGHNPQGFDPRPEIDRCRALVSGQSFVFADQYVGNLDAMAARWKVDGR